MNKKLLNILIKDLEHDIDNYIGNYGTIDERLNYTLTKILNILKVMNGEVPLNQKLKVGNYLMEQVLNI